MTKHSKVLKVHVHWHVNIHTVENVFKSHIILLRYFNMVFLMSTIIYHVRPKNRTDANLAGIRQYQVDVPHIHYFIDIIADTRTTEATSSTYVLQV